MPTNSSQSIDLAQLFGVAAQALAQNQGALNQADGYNGNHGDNMVQTFQLITQALNASQGKPPADQLALASKKLSAQAKVSGSAGLYAKGLAQASKQMKGQSAVTPDLAMSLVQTLLAGGQAQQPAAQQNPGADLMSALLGGSQPQQSSGGADLLGALLGGGQPQQSAGGAQDGLDMGDLLSAGLSFMQAKQQGKDNLSAAVSALMSASPLNQQSHRQQSGEVIASALLQAISTMAKK
ncbi:MAG: hypothetical protein HFACDABA_02831 [Anaerolineales bacterium]|nr:hypothetical protein [Anaerolineales bacterium]